MGPTFLTRPLAILVLSVTLVACASLEERAEKYYESGLALLEQGDVPRALIEFRNVFELVPNHREARTAYARVMLDEGRVNEAYGHYLRLVEQYPDDEEGRMELSQMAFLRGDWAEVDRHGAVLAEMDLGTPEARAIEIGRRYREAALADDAPIRRSIMVEAQALLDTNPELEVLRRVLIDGYTRDGDTPKVLNLLDGLIADRPDERDLYNQRLVLLAQMDDEAGLEAQLLDMVDRFTEDNTAKSTLIRFYVSRGEIDKAEDFLRSFAKPSDAEPDSFLALIQFVLQSQGEEAARAEIERGIAESPNPVVFRTLRAGLDFRAGKQEEAVADLRALLENSEPTNATRAAKIALARMLIGTGNEVGARRLVEEVLEESPTQVDGLKMKAAWLIDADETDAAISTLRLALDQDAEDSQAMTLMAQAYNRAGSHDLARDFLALAVEASGNAPTETVRYATQLIREERYLPAEDILLPALRLAPGNISLLTTLGSLYVGMKDEARGKQVVDTLRRVDTEQSLAAANQVELQLLEQQGGFDAAASFLEGLAAQDDSGLGAKVAVLRTRLAQNDAAGALSYAEELVAQSPDSDVYKFALYATRAATGDVEAAKTGYRTLLDQNPRRPNVWLELFRLTRVSESLEAAAAVIDEGLEIMPDDPNLMWAKASYLEQQNKIDEAIVIYEDLYVRMSNSPVVANNLASLLATYRDDPESLERAFTVARRLRDTNVAPFQDTYGWITFRQGDPEAALPYMERAAEGLPQDPIVQYHLARVYQGLERTEEALRQFRRAVEVAGPADTRDQILHAREEIQKLQAAPEK